MKRITFKISLYNTVDVPDGCPNTPDEAFQYCMDHNYDIGSYDWNTADDEHIISIDALDADGESGEAFYEE